MKEAYLLIKTGYEGIEELLDLNKTPRRLVKKVRNFQDENEKLKKEALDIIGTDTDDEFVIINAYHEDKISRKQYLALTVNIEQYCIQKWDGNEFKCHCKELGVNYSNETWFY